MGKIYSELYIHIIWSTKKREAMIKEGMEKSIYRIINKKCKKYKFSKIAVGNTKDHIHLLIRINPSKKISKFVAEVKGTSSFIVNKEGNNLYWQNGYGVLSVSKSGVQRVKNYVLNQKEHHKAGKNIINGLENVDGH